MISSSEYYLLLIPFQEERLYLEHERKSLQRMVLEQSELAAAERARAAIRQKKAANVERGERHEQSKIRS